PQSPAGLVSKAVFSADGKQMATTVDDGKGTIVLWDLQTGTRRLSFIGAGRQTADMAFSPDGRQFATVAAEWLTRLVNGRSEFAGWTSAITVWDVDSGRRLVRCTTGDGSANSVRFSADGRLLAAACGRQWDVTIWDVATARKVVAFAPPAQAVMAGAFGLTFSPSGTYVASGVWAMDRGGHRHPPRIVIWNIATGSQAAFLPHPAGYLGDNGFSCVAFSHNGQWLAAGAGKDTIVWPVPRLRK
ncbi:MAG TPA: hypothetical protein VFA18_10020, partial [Gemmataceae bacterium]|nr:hypothetical protein [Gemmataceae bacterium]